MCYPATPFPIPLPIQATHRMWHVGVPIVTCLVDHSFPFLFLSPVLITALCIMFNNKMTFKLATQDNIGILSTPFRAHCLISFNFTFFSSSCLTLSNKCLPTQHWQLYCHHAATVRFLIYLLLYKLVLANKAARMYTSLPFCLLRRALFLSQAVLFSPFLLALWEKYYKSLENLSLSLLSATYTSLSSASSESHQH